MSEKKIGPKEARNRELTEEREARRQAMLRAAKRKPNADFSPRPLAEQKKKKAKP